jgi:EAL domain-containing protein (putative c-di-GMP-specific phosphodiesterase class I)
MPDTIVSLAEGAGLITEIGRWVMERACRDRIRWQAPGTGDLTIAINVSPQQLMSAGFVGTVATILAETGTDPGVVMLEVTESVLVQDGDRALVVLKALKNLGVSIALDDFGTGYSSLSYLRRFPADVVKIDNGFVGSLGDPITSAVTSAVVDLAHVLGMTVVAEGVETAEQHVQVRELGCEACQGYFFARPMSVEALRALLHRDTGVGGLWLPTAAIA